VELTDNEAIAQSLAGKAEAFATIVRRHGQAVHGTYSAARIAKQQMTCSERCGCAPFALGTATTNRGRAPDRGSSGSHATPCEPTGGAADVSDDLIELSHDPWSDADARLDAARNARPCVRRFVSCARRTASAAPRGLGALESGRDRGEPGHSRRHCALEVAPGSRAVPATLRRRDTRSLSVPCTKEP